MQPLPPPAQTIRRSAGLFDGLQRGILSISGKDRIGFLHRLVSHDIKGLRPGQGRAACLLDRQGKILFAAIFHARNDDLLLETDPESLPRAREALEKYRISEDVQLGDVSSSYRILPLHGPAVPAILQRIWPQIPLPTGPLTHVKGPPGSGVGLMIRWDLLQMPGIHLWIEAAQAEAVRQTILEKGKPEGLILGGWELFDRLRIEAGVPWPGKEITPEVILNELGSEEWMSFTKGCYVGQEIVARIKYRAHPPRLLTGFQLEGVGDRLPSSGAPLYLDNQQVGTLTSICRSSLSDRVVALGFLKYGVSGNSVRVNRPNSPIVAQPILF